ncbi:amino acid ABC transporter permease [Variovorax ginsengisoli]|uniref:General L-amino acid transport system permease protein n=1 Tax=Variovorax ginsengisoli TaxID=363844 RepID=A0ABT9SGS1_9BURK|nr:amino acid ABC transporter permease [Variovorax ginsengisoli]MDP9903003.1 general L-amino acid transport system permease protein [Variovorax ginsengisoli]
MTLIVVPVCLWALIGLLWWSFTAAQWQVVSDNLRVFMVGTFPAEMIWRAWLCALILALLCGATLGWVVPPPSDAPLWRVGAFMLVTAMGAAAATPTLGWVLGCATSALCGWGTMSPRSPVRKLLPFGWGAGLIAMAMLLLPAGTERWGGLMVSVLVTLLASILSVPLGIGLALGRRSRFASARILCTGYIELMRSLPLILIVYWVWIVMPLLVPDTAVPDLFRGLLGFVLFFAAYVAEYVRSGLQSVPKGQIEAAGSLGMSPMQINRDIVLPQATRVVMPALVGNVLDIFNTVPLLFIIGLTDFLRAGQMVLINPQSGGRNYEIYLFMFAVYLGIASIITYGARRLEARMATGQR